MENQNKTENPQEECESCPICLERYGKQDDGRFLLKDGLCNSNCRKASKCWEKFECKHFVCVKCCEQMYENWYSEDRQSGNIACPMCRVNWYYFLKSRANSGAYEGYDDCILNPSPTEIETHIFDPTDYESEEESDIEE